MQIRPLTNAPGVERAIAEARARYNALKGGPRPRVAYHTSEGFLIRFVMGTDPSLDRAEIMDVLGEPQEIVVFSTSWVDSDFSNSLAGVPFRPLSQDPFTMRPRRLYAQGDIWAYGGLSGSPIEITVNPDVIFCSPGVPWSQEDFAVVFPEVSTLTETGLTISEFGVTYELLTGMPIYNFQPMVGRLGDDASSPFYLDQAGGGGYAAAPSLYGGTFIFAEYSDGQEPALPLKADLPICLGGEMEVYFNNHTHLTMDGGFAAGGDTIVGMTLRTASDGGFCLGGEMSVAARRVWSEAMSGGFCLGGTTPAARGGAVLTGGGFCAGGTMPVASYNRPKQYVTVAMSGGFAQGGTATIRAKRQDKLSGGFCLGGTMAVTTASITYLKPIIYGTSQVLLYSQRTAYRFFNAQLYATSHYGGQMRFSRYDASGALLPKSDYCTITTGIDASGNGFVEFSYTGSVYPSTQWFTVRAREVFTAPDGTTKDVYGDPTQIMVTVQASTPITATGSAGKLSWSGGTAPYTISRYGNIQVTDGNTSLITMTSTYQASVRTSSVCCEATAYFVVRDSAGRTSNQVLLSACGISVCGGGDAGGDGQPGYLDIDFYLPKSVVEVGELVTVTPYPDTRGGAYSLHTGSTAVATVSGNVVRGAAQGSTTVVMTQQGANGLKTTSLSKAFSVATNPWELQWADFQVFVPTSKSCSTNNGSGYTVNFYELKWLESRDGQHAIWYASEAAYGCYTIGEDENPSTTYPTWPTATNPFPSGITDLPWHLVTGADLNGFGGLPGFGLPPLNQYYVCYLYRRK